MALPENFGRRKPAQRLATILSIGKATPAYCEKSMISKRRFVLTEEIINKNPNFSTYSSPSLEIRQQILAAEVPKLAMEAASKAIQEWGQPKSQSTHLIFSAVSGMEMPGADNRLTKLLGLPSVKRVMMYFQGCYAGGTILRMAKDIAENNAGARVLVIISDITLPTFRAPNEHNIPSLISNAIMGDGAAAMIIGADPNVLKERPLFQIVSATETIIPDSEGAIKGHMHEAGISIHLSRDVPKLIANNIDKCLAEALSPKSINDWNSFFWIVHPLGNAILDQIEIKLGLILETRHELSELGNVSSATVFFILDEMRRRSTEVGKATTGEGLQWGILFVLGASITVETVVLRSYPTNIQLIHGKE